MMSRRLEDLWDICKLFVPAVLIGGAAGVGTVNLCFWLTDAILDLDSWLYLLIPVVILALLYRVVYVRVYRRTYSL